MSGFRATGANAVGATNGFGSGFNSGFGSNQPPEPQSGFGTQAATGFGSAQPSDGFGSDGFMTPDVQQPPANGFGSGGFNSTGFGSAAAPAAPSNGFGSAAPPPNGFGSAAPPPNGFGSAAAPTAPPNGFGLAAAPTNNFGTATPADQPNGFGSTGFGTQESGFGSQSSGFESAATIEKPATSKTDESTGFGSGGFGSATDGFGTPAADGSAAPGCGSPTKNTTLNASVAPSQAGDETAHQKSKYVPQDRDMEKIFEEDSCCKLLYDIAFENDEDVNVENVDNVTKIDSWSDVKLDNKLLENIKRAGYVRPRKIQSYTIPYILEGKDLRGQAETGSGKSAAFLIPIITMIAKQKAAEPTESGVKNKPRCVIIEPTRELAIQLYEQGRKLANDTGVQVVKSYGEYKWTANADEIMRGCDIVIGTPGRLNHFMSEGIIGLQKLKYFVLDEADRLLDQNFKEVINTIKKLSTFPKDEDLQTLLFSATFPKDVDQWAKELLKSDFVDVKNKRSGSANQKIRQEFRECPKNEKKEMIVQVLKEELAEAQKKDFAAEQPRTLVFVTTRRDADVMAVYLCESDFRAATINGDRTQSLREEALRDFRDNKVKVLVATDVCARGLDIKDLDNVINMDLPQDITTYVHRIGRTGRLRDGRALSLFDPDSESDQKLAKPLAAMLKKDNHPVPEYISEASAGLSNTKEFGKGFGGNEQNFGQGFGGTGFGDKSKEGGFGSGGFGAAGDTGTSGFGTGGW